MRSRQATRVLGLFLLSCLATTMAYAGNVDVGDVALVEDSAAQDILGGFTTSMPNVYLAKAACAFYQTHEDVYDAIFVFNNQVANIQQGWTVNNKTKGIGRDTQLPDQSGTFCSTKKRLRVAVSMGGIHTLPADPDQNAPIVLMYPLTGMELMCHEFGHYWLAAVNFNKDDGAGRQCLLRGWENPGESQIGGETCNDVAITGYNQHWSHYLNGCSLMYSSCIEDRGVGDDGKHHFWINYPIAKYSQLDQYLMGLRTKDEVTDPIFVVGTGDNSVGSASIPMGHGNAGSELTGTRIDVSIDDIIRENGPRTPEKDICHFKAAYILVHPFGQRPSEAQIQAVNNYRARMETFYPEVTDNLGSFDTTLDGCGTGTKQCPGEKSSTCGAQTGDCENGQLKCQGLGLVMTCRNNVWVFDHECALGEACADGICTEIPEDGDTDSDTATPEDGDTEEAVDTPDLDKEGGTETLDGDTTDTAPVCTPKDKRCLGNIVQTCAADGQSWEDGADCGQVNKTCNPTTHLCVADQTPSSGSSGGCANSGSTSLWLLGTLLLSLGLSWRRKEMKALRAQ